MVLAGSINKQIVGFINAKAAARSAFAARTAIWSPRGKRPHGTQYRAKRSISASSANPRKVDTTVLDQVLGRELIPVLAPIAPGADGETYNVNADTFAGAIAGALRAKRLAVPDRRAGRARQVTSNLIKNCASTRSTP